ncbi:MAG: hypothetical protein AAF550_13075 [Myxococcota bacterium]
MVQSTYAPASRDALRPTLSVCLICGALFSVGCGTPASRAYAELDEVTVRMSLGAYILRYLAPPWSLVSSDDGRTLLQIDADGERFSPDSGFTPKYTCQAEVISGNALNRATQAERTAAAEESILVPQRPIVTDGGNEGTEFLSFRDLDMRFLRRAYFDSERGGVVRVVFEANPDLDEREVTKMLQALSVDPEDPELAGEK